MGCADNSELERLKQENNELQSIAQEYNELKHAESNETSMETSVDSSSSTYACPHCAGLGRRTNNVTGMFGDCSSCGADGQVTQSEYDRLSK